MTWQLFPSAKVNIDLHVLKIQGKMPCIKSGAILIERAPHEIRSNFG